MLKKHFTFTELVLVVSVIAFLATLFFPFPTKSREMAKQFQCINNLKVLGTGIALYTADYDGYIPPGYQFSRMPEPWHVYLGVPNTATMYKKYICPSATPESSSATYLAHSYACNMIGTGKYSKLMPASEELVKITSVQNPFKSFAIVDKKDGYTGIGVTSADDLIPETASTKVAYRHEGTLNMLFIDGHVKNMTPLPSVGFDDSMVAVTYFQAGGIQKMWK